MKPLVELITAWQAFADTHRDPDVESFCCDYLSNKNQKDDPDPERDVLLSKLIGKSGSLIKTYLKLALRQIPDMEMEWFYILDTLNDHKEIRKTDVISFRLLLEPTTGIDILNRMLKAGLISERVDPADKRARLIKPTDKGIESYKKVNSLFNQVISLLFTSLNKDQKAMLILALGKLTNEHYEKIVENKTQAIGEIETFIKDSIK
ncbi:hypothetical protein ASU31_16210 [Pedobacter ginsenosidimutans]|uniref:HTH marR-type domain-containing protein n=1 Tax=Pedobacter ginsenosidimutans TaxID=687842 RepID=A0A0T5VLV8_9SPHI|nr:winged helix DNA-binding protein [Pedobacter ginsenosidimutans]KRT14867.1 hypothetical protein ASU31_16210 [Pedobacter ginsenosidimutans]